MTRNLYLKRLVLILAIVLSGCVRDTTLDPGVERKVVVEFVLTEDSVQNLYLFLTKEPGELAAPAIQDAEIKFINVSNRSEPEHLFAKVADNQWSLDYSGIPGDEYRLEVKVDGYDLVWAEQKMPEKMKLVRAATEAVINPQPLLPYMKYGAYYNIDFIPDYLMIRGTKRDKETGEFILVEELCTDYPGVEEINVTGRFYDGNPKWRTGIGWHWSEIGWEGADYVYHDSPVDGDDGVWTYMFPNLIGSNLHEGFLLIRRVDDNHAGLEKLYDFPIGESFHGKAFCISGSFYMNQAYPSSDYTQVLFHEYLIASSLSPDYGLFLKDAWQFKKTHEGGDLSSIYLRDNIYSNIQGGLGIFGAMVSSMTPFDGYYQEK